MDYFQPKMRMCHDLKLDFDGSKDYVLRGLLSCKLDLYAVGRSHIDEDDLLEDLLRWERMNVLQKQLW